MWGRGILLLLNIISKLFIYVIQNTTYRYFSTAMSAKKKDQSIHSGLKNSGSLSGRWEPKGLDQFECIAVSNIYFVSPIL